MKGWKHLFYYVYSLLFCLRYLPFKQALFIPIYIHPSVLVRNLYREAISYIGPIRNGLFVFGFEGTFGQSNYRSLILINREAQLIVGTEVSVAKGTRLIIKKEL